MNEPTRTIGCPDCGRITEWPTTALYPKCQHCHHTWKPLNQWDIDDEDEEDDEEEQAEKRKKIGCLILLLSTIIIAIIATTIMVYTTPKNEADEISYKYKTAPPTAQNAINALKRIEARIEIGINFNDYTAIVGESWAEVKKFTNSSEGQTLTELNLALSKAIANHRLAIEIWKYSVDYPSLYEAIQANSDMLRLKCWMQAGKWTTLAESLLNPEQTTQAIADIAKAKKEQKDLRLEWQKIMDDRL